MVTLLILLTVALLISILLGTATFGLVLALGVIGAIAIGAFELAAGGFLLVFGDILIFVLIVIGIVKLVKRCKKKENE